MAHLMPQDQFDELQALARPLLDKARALAHGATLLPEGMEGTADNLALVEEVQAYSTALMALNHVTPLVEESMFVAMGAAVGTQLAQAFSPHAVLLKLMQEQQRSTYNEVRAASLPVGRMQ